MDSMVSGRHQRWLSVCHRVFRAAEVMRALYFEDLRQPSSRLVLLGKWLESQSGHDRRDAIRALNALRPTIAVFW